MSERRAVVKAFAEQYRQGSKKARSEVLPGFVTPTWYSAGRARRTQRLRHRWASEGRGRWCGCSIGIVGERPHLRDPSEDTASDEVGEGAGLGAGAAVGVCAGADLDQPIANIVAVARGDAGSQRLGDRDQPVVAIMGLGRGAVRFPLLTGSTH